MADQFRGLLGIAGRRRDREAESDLEAQRRATLPLLQAQGREAGLSPSMLGGLGTQLGSAQTAGELVATAINAQSMLGLPGVSPVAAVAEAASIAGAEQQVAADAANLRKTLLANEEAGYGLIERRLDRYGSQLNRAEYTDLSAAMVQGQRTLDIVNYIGDVVGSTTPGQLTMPAMGAVRGKLQAGKFPMYTAVQRLMETKKSTLREGERKAIDDFLGSPDRFWTGMMSYDAATIEKFNTIGEWTRREMEAQKIPLDEKTRALLDLAAPPDPSFYNWTLPKGAELRDPVGAIEGREQPAATRGGLLSGFEGAHAPDYVPETGTVGLSAAEKRRIFEEGF